MQQSAIPAFYLYGEPHRAVESTFIHLERLDDRSRPSEWTIRPHSHADMHQVFLLDTGGGTVSIEGEASGIAAPTIFTIPATAVHGFDWQEETTGWVLTVACTFYDRLVQDHGDLASLFDSSYLLALDPASCDVATRWAKDLDRELTWSATGRRAAAAASVLRLAVLCARLAEAVEATHVSVAPPPAAALVARYRALVEESYRDREPIGVLAGRLGCSQSSLRSACKTIAGRSPSQILDDRALLEAKRMLLYSHLSVAQIGYSLGFSDPAYFSRFFTRYEKRPPSDYRQYPPLK